MYNMFSKYYDRVMGSYDPWFTLIDRHTAHLGPGSSMIDYGCGTGNVLLHYRGKFRPSGVDISAPMLNQAIAKMPEGRFVLGDMVSFRSQQRHDVSLCLFDTINHVLDQRDWTRFFTNVAASTAREGVFIVDLNTTGRLEMLARRPALVQEFDSNYLYMRIHKRGDRRFAFDVRVLKRTGPATLEEEREEIEESSMSGAEAHHGLKECFLEVKVYNEKIDRIEEEALDENEKYRWFFVCTAPIA